MIDAAEFAARVTRLPSWARSYIERLEQECNDLARRVDVLSQKGPANSNIRIDGLGDRPDIVFPANSHVDFLMGKDPDGQVKITVHHDGSDPHVLIVSNSSLRGDGALSVVPSSSNTVRVRTSKY